MPSFSRSSWCPAVLIAATLTSFSSSALGQSPPATSSRSQIAELGRMVRFDPSFKVRAAAARKLGDLADRGARGDPEVVRALIDALQDRDHIVRGVSAFQLGRHTSDEAVRALELAAKKDEHAFVRETASRALETATKTKPAAVIVARANAAERARDKPRRVEVGRIELARATEHHPGLRDAIESAIDELLGSRKPAMFPREDADARIDIQVSREDAGSTVRELGISYRVRVLIIELPAATLKHSANATATAHTKRSSAKKISELEQRVALEATTRAVNDALSLLDRS